MADTDADSQLLDRIDGKYGEGDFDLDNADEDALLDESNTFEDVAGNETAAGYGRNNFYNEVDDVLDLEAQDVELEEDSEERNNFRVVSNSLTVSSTTLPDLDTSDLQFERERSTNKFKSERQQVTKLGNIPDSLDEVIPKVNNNNSNRGQFRGRGRGSNFRNQSVRNNAQRQRADNKTVLINPHFKGQVKINNDARLAWDARHRLNQRHLNRGGGNNRKVNTIQPWINKEIVPNNQQFQGIPQQFNNFQPPPQAQAPPVWNQYPGNSYNQIPQQQIPVTQQHVFMQPLPPPIHNVYPNQQHPHYNQPIQQYNSPMYQNHINPGYNPQFIPPPNQYNQLPEPFIPNFTPNQPPPGYAPPPVENSFIPPPSNPTFSQPIIQFDTSGPPPNNNNNFNNQNRFIRPKSNFNNVKKFNKTSPIKRRVENNVDARKKKRNLSSSNLHEVQTVEIPDTTVQEEKQLDDEDDDMRLYRKKIEEQKRLREKILADKEKRRQEAILNKTEGISKATEAGNSKQNPQIQRNVHHLQLTQNKIQPNLGKKVQLKKVITNQNANNKVVNTDSGESNYDKQHLASFLSNRKILAKDQSLIDTSLVVVSNLAAGTTDVKLRKLCQGIGDIKKLQMSPKERQATIQFTSVASAHAFFKKFQRTMLDLSMIQVALQPMSS